MYKLGWLKQSPLICTKQMYQYFQVTSHDQANRMDIYEATVEVLQPEIDKLKALMNFRVSFVIVHTIAYVQKVLALIMLCKFQMCYHKCYQ